MRRDGVAAGTVTFSVRRAPVCGLPPGSGVPFARHCRATMTTMTRRPALILLALLPGCARPTSANLPVSVAASLQTVMQEVAAKYSTARVDLNFGASGALAQQIARGAPADIFFSASSKSMD